MHATCSSAMLSACTYLSCSLYTSAPCRRALACQYRTCPYGYSLFRVRNEARWLVSPALIEGYVGASASNEQNFSMVFCIHYVDQMDTSARTQVLPCCVPVTSKERSDIFHLLYTDIVHAKRQHVFYKKYPTLDPCDILETWTLTVVSTN